MRRAAKRGLLSTAPRTKRVVTQRLHRDDFGEVAERKRTAEATSDDLGHALRGWHQRPNDPYGRWNASCHCGAMAVVATEKPDGIDAFVYGPAVTDKHPER
jgi:hypothetical protein